MTADELIEECKKRGAEDPFEAACWFASVMTARAILDAYDLKDMAHMIMNGEPWGGPFKTEDDLTEWLNEEFLYDVLIKELNSHFGVTP